MWLSNADKELREEEWNTTLMELENDQFVGRGRELQYFRDFIESSKDTKRIVHVYGMGGIGKTFLIHAFQRLAERLDGMVFLGLDSEDFAQSPSMLAEQLLFQLDAKLSLKLSKSHETPLNQCLHMLKESSKNHRIIIAVDTYEKIGSLDRWFREVFLRSLPESISIILAGRHPLTAGWMESPAWRSIITQVKLSAFTYDQTRLYLSKAGVTKHSDIQDYWRFTNGHPLTLSLSAMAYGNKEDTDHHPHEKQEILTYLTSKWLSEVNDPELQRLLEAAAILRHFDQATLNFILDERTTTTAFTRLTSLSFVNRTNHGWGIHEIIRSAIILNIQERTPEHYESLKRRSASYYLQQINRNQSSTWEIAEYFYHLGEEVIRSAFFQEKDQQKKYIEPVGAHNFKEVEEYFQKRNRYDQDSVAHYYNRETDTTYHYYVSAEHNQKENDLIGAEYVRKLGFNVGRIVKNEEGEMVGLSLIVPINKHTIEQLKKEPVSRAYFRQLSKEEEEEYRVDEDSYSGWFIRMLDCLNPEDSHTRSFLLYSLFPLLLSGGRIITSTPIPFFQQLTQAFGFEKVPNATHYDFGPDQPSPTFLLDVRGPRLIQYLKQFSQTVSLEKDHVLHVADRHQLTKREKEILLSIHGELSNKAIAEQLHITEITVKKHVGSILKKFQVKNRTQLMKRIMEMSPYL
ncbi:MAG: LuxR C-terminal-related transcriptional regulator [Halobacillus sp.]|uniref:LuxR C-terminal-related transcriptional regulator n=1 Tax=Halobacillus sp. TaxID=56800 RepID=UPI003BB0B50D